jgi:hypothetical protein
MKTIIAGTRTINDYNLLLVALSKIDWEITEVVCGMADGVDSLGLRWAEENNIKLSKFAAEWNVYGRSAGPIRNAQMAKYADACIVIWDGESKGSKNMIRESLNHGLKLKTFLQGDLDKHSGPIKNNPIFGKEAIKISEGKESNIQTKTISLNSHHLIVYEDPKKNSKLENMVVEIIKELERIKK